MDNPPVYAPSIPLIVTVGVMIWACIGVWAWVILGRHKGRSVLPVAWRRPVPWRGVDLAFFVVILLASVYVVDKAATYFFNPPTHPARKVENVASPLLEKGPEKEAESTGEKKTKEEKDHYIVLLLRDGSPGVVAFCFFMAVIFAPFSEEILFRMFLQGYLEKLDGLLRRQARRYRVHAGQERSIEPNRSFFTALPWGVAPVLITSAIFAMLHYREAGEAPPTDWLFWSMSLNAIVMTVAIVVLIYWLRTARQAQLSDFGIVVREIPRDIVRGLVAFFAVTVPVYAIQAVAQFLVPEGVAEDPISLFFLALAFGTVWCRTHRLVPSLVMHMSFNGFSLAVATYVLR